MEKAIISIQSAYRGYAVRKSSKPYKPLHNSTDWKFHTSGNLYKSTIFPITEDFHKGLQPSFPYLNPNPNPKTLTPKPPDPAPAQPSRPSSYTSMKKPLITLFFQETKSPELSIRQTSSPGRTSIPSVSKPQNFSISPQKSPQSQSQSRKTQVTLFKYTLTPCSKPVVPIQTYNPRPGHREKFIKQINGITLQFRANKPEDPARPNTQKSDRRPAISMAKSVSTRNKFVPVDKYSTIYPESTSRKFYSSRKVVYGKHSAPNSNGQSHLETSKQQGKMNSPYESIWTEKLLLNFYNLKICPSEQSGRKRFKLVKAGGKTKRKLSEGMAEKHL